MFSETVEQKDKDGNSFMDILKTKGILPGIKVDKGVENIPGSEETFTKGLDSLASMCKEFYAKGCRFAKWRAVLRIGNGMPSHAAIEENAHGLARYAATCQENGLVPIVEPEILQDGDHTIEKCAEVSEVVINRCVQKLLDFGVLLEGCLLKPNMVTQGIDCKVLPKPTHADVAYFTVRTLGRSLLSSVPGVVFLSGGSSESHATSFLNQINRVELPRPW